MGEEQSVERVRWQGVADQDGEGLEERDRRVGLAVGRMLYDIVVLFCPYILG